MQLTQPCIAHSNRDETMPSCTLEHLGKSPHTLVHRQDGKYVDTKGHERSAERGILQSSISNSFSEEE